MKGFFKIYWPLIVFGFVSGAILGCVKYIHSNDVKDLYAWSVGMGTSCIVGSLLVFVISKNQKNDEDEQQVFSTEDVPPPKIFVKINACDSPFAWYYERCGEIFEVLEYDDEMFITTSRIPQSHIRRVDCTVIKL